MWKNIVCSVVLVFIYGCSREPEITSSTEYLTVSLPHDDILFIVPDSVFEEVTYIPLETREDNLIFNIDKVIHTDSLIYILDKKQNQILVFNSQGTFQKKLNKVGVGEGYYLNLTDFQVEKNLIYVLSPACRKIIVYDLELEYIENIPFKDYASSFLLDSKYFYLYGEYQNKSLNNILVLKRESGKPYSRYASFPKQQLGVGDSTYPFSQDTRSHYICYPYEYSAYKLLPDGQEKILEIIFEADKIYPKELQTASNDERMEFRMMMPEDKWPIESIGGFVSSKKYYMFSFVYMTLPYSVFYDKITKQMKTGVMFPSHKYPLITQDIKYYNESSILQVFSPDQIDSYRQVSRMEMIPQELLSVRIDDNPILAIYKLK